MNEQLPTTADRPPRTLWFEGPNYTADAVVIDTASDRILLIQRKDTGEWALPGGFIDDNEQADVAAKREAFEETGAELQTDGALIFQGKVDDPRATATAWIETSAYLFTTEKAVPVEGRDDAQEARWHPINELPLLYGSHEAIVVAALKTLEDS